MKKLNKWKCYSTYVEISCADDRMIDVVHNLYWGWIYKDKSKNYRDTQANLLARILETTYSRIMANYYKWVQIGYNPEVIREL